MPFPFLKKSNREQGREGEALAVGRLKALGYRILETNWRCRGGELDIVARDGDVVVFVEVKARGSDRFGSPLDAVDARKRRHLVAAAREYLARHRLEDAASRFDVVAVRLDRSPPEVEVFACAFDVEE